MEIISSKQLEKMNYTEFKEFLDNENIKYELKNNRGFFGEMAEICPINEKYESRNFYLDDGKQELKYKNPKIKTKLDALDYKEFIEYLNNKNIKYEELRDWDFFILDYILVTPISKKLKGRIFFTDDGSQAFDGDFIEL